MSFEGYNPIPYCSMSDEFLLKSVLIFLKNNELMFKNYIFMKHLMKCVGIG